MRRSNGPYGPQGPQGEQGPPGPVGPAGSDGSIILAGAGVPDENTGKPGDFYLDLTSGNLFGPKMAEGWGVPTNLQGPEGPQGEQGPQGPEGPQGPAGPQGPQRPEGPQGPAGEDGNDGADGQDGQDGEDGQDGQDGSQIFAGNGGPDNSLGKNGDYYLDKTSYDLYGPKTGSSWGTPIHLQGPKGDQGSVGPQGPQGPAGPPGADGVSGWERVETGCSTVPGNNASGSAVSCPIGKKILGGGVVFYDSNTCSSPKVVFSTFNQTITHSGPSSDTQWNAGVLNTSNTDIYYTIAAICATVN